MMQLILLAFDPVLLLVASGNEPKCHSKMPDFSRSPAKRRWLHSFISQQELSLRRRLNDEQNHVSCLQLCLRRMPSMHVNTWPSHRLPEAEHAASLVNSHELHIITRGKQRNRFNMRKHYCFMCAIPAWSNIKKRSDKTDASRVQTLVLSWSREFGKLGVTEGCLVHGSFHHTSGTCSWYIVVVRKLWQDVGTLDRVREESGIADDSMEARKTFFYCAVASLDLEKKHQNCARTRCGQKCAMQFHFIPFHFIISSFLFISLHVSSSVHSVPFNIPLHFIHAIHSVPCPFIPCHSVSPISFHVFLTHSIAWKLILLFMYLQFYFISFRLISSHVIHSFHPVHVIHFISCHAIPVHSIPFTSNHFIPAHSFSFDSCHVMSCRSCVPVHSFDSCHSSHPPASPSHVASYDMISFRLVSFDFMSCQLISFHFISLHFISSRFIHFMHFTSFIFCRLSYLMSTLDSKTLRQFNWQGAI